jgi:glycosyltransferase involved in cell wall biosynthesis
LRVPPPGKLLKLLHVKLIIQIPCLNEEDCLPVTLADLPRELPGFDTVEWLIVDDGSSDRTVEVARENGVDHVVRFNTNKGLAVAFQAGLDASLKLGADVIVTTDADNQYQAANIPDLLRPILSGEADMVVGARPIKDHKEFSPLKKFLQRWGSWVVRRASGTDIQDATSGFRAYTREAALRINVVSRFSYTLETVILAGKSDLAITSVPIQTNPQMRESRLFGSMATFVRRQVTTIFRIYFMYEPLPVFLLFATILATVGFILLGRFLWFYLTEVGPTGHVQSLVVAAAFLILSVLFVMLGIIGDLLRSSRILQERTLHRVRHIELALGVDADHLLENGRSVRAPLSEAPPPERRSAEN